MLPKIGNSRSLSDHAYMVLKEAILNNTFKPRDTLLEESIAAKLGVSRTPLRTALKRLEFEKLVVINSSKKAVVAEIQMEDMVKVFVFRLALEPLIARVACGTAAEEGIRQVEDCLARNRQAIEERHFVAIIACELEFDKLLVGFTGNEFLTDGIAMIHSYLQRFLVLSTTTYPDAPASLTEHHAILDALRDKAPDLAEERTRHHLRNVAMRLGFSLPV